MDNMAIGEVARRAGVATSAVRYYERIGLLPPTKRVNKHRRYDETVLQWLALIRFAQQAGFTLDEIQVLFKGFEPDTPPAERWKTLAHEKLAEIDAMIERAHAMKHLLVHGLECNCLSLDECAVIIERNHEDGDAPIQNAGFPAHAR
jgi:MerR family transcriptional regulator, redox-sensitive transcriptional activator SoxR